MRDWISNIFGIGNNDKPILIIWLILCRRKQDGVYASYLFGPKGKQIKVAP